MQRFLAFFTAVVVCAIVTPVWADWYEGDSYKMHFPQLPDPNGWDIEIFTPGHEVADDWRCIETGTVDDIHFWFSLQGDPEEHTIFDIVHVGIYSDVPANTGQFPYSTPGDLLWEQTFGIDQVTIVKDYGTGRQGFADPQLGTGEDAWGLDDHQLYHQVNIVDIDDPFVQKEGEIYWLGLWVDWFDVQQAPLGWKTADVNKYPQPNTGQHFQDDAVFRSLDGFWEELIDPYTGQSLDMAFVITTIPEPGGVVLMLAGIAGIGLAGRRRN